MRQITANDFVRKLISSRVAYESEVEGCTDEEIDALERALAVHFPKAYREFLAAVGHCAGRFWGECNFRADEIVANRKSAEEILENWESGRLTLPERAVVFTMRRGEQFHFFLADGSSDDPPTFFYYEGDGRFKESAKSIWDVIYGELPLYERR